MRPQTFFLRLREPKHEIFGKASAIAVNLFVNALGWHFVELCQINIDHDLVTTNQIDSPFDKLHGARDTIYVLPGRHNAEGSK